MKPARAANLALVLALLAWPLCWYGFWSSLADFSRDTPRAIVEAHQQQAFACLAAGLTCLFSSVWLSGVGLAGARIRSMVAAVLAAGLVGVAVFAMRPR